MKKITILFLEDSEIDLELIRSYLDDEIPYNLTHVNRRDDFIEALEKNSYDLLLLDYSLPGFDGLSALEIVKQIHPNIPVILISGNIGEEIAIETLKQGATDYVLKQRIQRLIPSIKRAIKESKEHQERLYAEQALRSSEERYRSLFNDALDMIHIVDCSGEIIDANPTELKTLGYTQEEYIGKNISDIVHPDYKIKFQNYFGQIMDSREIRKCETALINKSGEYIFVEVNAVPEIIDGQVVSVRFFLHNITEKKKAEEAIQLALKEKDILLKEIHHRVKNNLQIIISLLNLQSHHVTDKEALKAFDESRNRIYSMALVHEKLYQSSDFSKIDIREYIQSISKELFHAYAIGDHVELKLEIDDINFSIDQAIPCGLIINELFSNALKYAFPDGRQGCIHVKFNQQDEQNVRLLIKDNGVGVDEYYDFYDTKSLGHVLVKVLATQLNSEIIFHTNHGVHVELLIPVDRETVLAGDKKIST